VLTHTSPTGKVTTNVYNVAGKLITTTKPDGTVFTFDSITGNVLSESYSNGLVNTISTNPNQTVITGSSGLITTVGNNAFGEVNQYKIENGSWTKNYIYTYYADGNIKTISLNGTLLQTFTYDLNGELTRVDDAAANQSIRYTYDAVGNAINVLTYAYTTGTLDTALTTQNYTYNTQNQRTGLSYDAYGNLTSLGGYSFTWSNGRLSGAANGTKAISYTYNYNGIRMSKTVNNVTTDYAVDDNNNVIEQDDGTNNVKFVYDSNGLPIYMIFNGTTYDYEKNLQGDVIGLLDSTGNEVVSYTYDVWGVQTSCTGSMASTLGIANPLRYRGYYFDGDIGLYYLQSRYYSPELMRFISQDDPGFSNAQGQPLGSNLYAYCLNNPVMNVDPTGCLSATQVFNMFSIATIFSMFMAMMYANYAYGLAAVGVHILKLVTPISLKAFWWNPKAALILIAAAVIVVVAAIVIYYAKKSKESAKARATDCPSWLAGGMNAKPPKWGESAQEYATRLLDIKYRPGKWKKGAGTEFNQIVKYLQRHMGMK